MSIPHNVADPLLSSKEMIEALELMFRRMDAINAICTIDFPLYSSKNTNAWTVSSGGSWMGGFWGACWWLRAKLRKR